MPVEQKKHQYDEGKPTNDRRDSITRLAFLSQTSLVNVVTSAVDISGVMSVCVCV